MDEYFSKLEDLPIIRLEMLVKRYQKIIQSLQITIRDATIVGLSSIIEYNQKELDKKQAELSQLEKLLQEKRQK